jgi:hypothetical protein
MGADTEPTFQGQIRVRPSASGHVRERPCEWLRIRCDIEPTWCTLIAKVVVFAGALLPVFRCPGLLLELMAGVLRLDELWRCSTLT